MDEIQRKISWLVREVQNNCSSFDHGHAKAEEYGEEIRLFISELLNILEENQWSCFNIVQNRLVQEDPNICPDCCNSPYEGHREECKIGKALKK